MKIYLFFVHLLIHLSISAQAVPELYPANDRQTGHLGYYLEDGTNVVKPQFCSASYNTDGYYLVSKAEHKFDEYGRRDQNHIPGTEKFGLLDGKGNFIIDLNNDYEGIGVGDSVIYVIKNNLYGTVNDKNEIVIPIEYSTLEIDDKNRIRAQKKSKYGVINHLNKIIIPFQYDFIGSTMPDGKGFLAIVRTENKTSVINQDNQLIVPLTKYSLMDLYKTVIVASNDKKFGVFDYKLNPILPFEFESIYVEENEIKAYKDEYRYVYSLKGELIKKENISEGVKMVN
ncbi:WG repeat-containing protein [Chryseobacterium sp. RLHN22]|uniref:WG repeat-containing protein n=1 Tax=Chryseobacterium sp. RLHN22 TaxID=3437885 RepID=UPI003D9B38E4